MDHLNEKAPCAGHAEGLRNTHHSANYLSILPRCKYSAHYKYGLFFEGHPIQILLDGSFIAWIDGYVFHAKDFEALQNILNNEENCHD
jgi:hypothetical protein